MRRGLLHAEHQAAGASFREVSGWLVPSVFSDVGREVAALGAAAGLLERTPVGRLWARGADAADLLNRLSTNRVDPLAPGGGVATAITTPKGRLVDYLLVLRPSSDLLLLTSPERRKAVAEWIGAFTFEEDVRVEDVTESTAMVGVAGPLAARVVEGAIGASVGGLPALGCIEAPWRGGSVLVARTGPLGQSGFDLVVEFGDAGDLWRALAEAGGPLGALPVGEDAAEAARVAAWAPRWGRELDGSRNPLEAGLEAAISWDKGCYVGQEVVARLRTYRRVQRYLVGMVLEARGGGVPASGARVMADGSRVGSVTSAAPAPGGGWVAMAYVLRHAAVVGQRVEVEADGGFLEGSVVRAPEVPVGAPPAGLLEGAEGLDYEEG